MLYCYLTNRVCMGCNRKEYAIAIYITRKYRNDNDKQDCINIGLFGMSLHAPYSGEQTQSNVYYITDVSSGMIRRLMMPQGTCGKYLNMSPEIYANEEPFHGFVIDL